MFILIDTFNKTEISRHRSIDAALKADISHQKAVKRVNGQNSYIPTKIKPIGKDKGVNVYNLE